MTANKKAKEKAQELVDTMRLTSDINGDYIYHESAKLCALIAVDEILYELSNEDVYPCSNYIFWQEVKTEIEAL